MKKLLLLLSLLLATNAWGETKADYLHCVYENQSPDNHEQLIKIQNYEALMTNLNLEVGLGRELMGEWEKKAVEHTYDFIYIGSDAEALKMHNYYRLNRKTLVLVWCPLADACSLIPSQCEVVSKEKYNKIKENHKDKIKAFEKERTKKNKI
jgi:hypothetical protein